MNNEKNEKFCEIYFCRLFKLLGKCQNSFNLKLLFENIWINILFIPAVPVVTDESNFSLKKLQAWMQTLNSLLPWCVRSCNRHACTICSTMCCEEALTLKYRPGFRLWMDVNIRCLCSWIQGITQIFLSPFTYKSCLQTSCLQIIMQLQVLFKELPRTLYILSEHVALPLHILSCLIPHYKSTAQVLWQHLARGAVVQG